MELCILITQQRKTLIILQQLDSEQAIGFMVLLLHTLCQKQRTDFELSYAQKMCIDSSKDGKKQCGAFQMILSDASGNIIAGVDIYKASDGTKGRYRMIVDGKVQKKPRLICH